MGKKVGAKQLPNSKPAPHTPISLREEATGKIQTKASSNIKSILRVEHLTKLAVWASNEALIPSLGAFYGQHLATVGEAMGVPPDPSLITCQRCETVLHPQFNSTVRIEKNRAKVRHRHRKSVNITQNNVVYKCHFCLHQNLKRGTPKGHMKGICPSKEKSSLESKPPKAIPRESAKIEKGIISKDEANEIDVLTTQVVAKDVAIIDSPATPSNISVTTLLGGKKRRRNSSASKKAIETASMSAKVNAEKTLSTASKRRRKSWTCLKEIAQSNEHENNRVANLKIPFFL